MPIPPRAALGVCAVLLGLCACGDTSILTKVKDIVAQAAPRIKIEQGAADIPSGTQGYSIGTATVNTSLAVTFTIRNYGGSDLLLTGTGGQRVQIGGADAALFVVTTQPTTPITPSAPASFVITFTPTSAGEKTATVTVRCNDPDASTYSFTIKGTATTTQNSAPTVNIQEGDVTVSNGVEATFTAAASDTDGDTLTYQWYVDDAAAAGETSITFKISRTPSVRTTYAIKVEVSDGKASGSASVTLTVQAPGVSTAKLYHLDAGAWILDPDPPDSTIAISDWSAALYALARDGTLYKLETSWQQEIVPALSGAIGITSLAGTLYALTDTGQIDTLDGVSWTPLPTAAPAASAALQGWGQTLYALTATGTLYSLDGGQWATMPVPAGAIDLASSSGALYVLTNAGEIYVLDGDWRKEPVSAPAGSVEIEGRAGTLYVFAVQ